MLHSLQTPLAYVSHVVSTPLHLVAPIALLALVVKRSVGIPLGASTSICFSDCASRSNHVSACSPFPVSFCVPLGRSSCHGRPSGRSRRFVRAAARQISGMSGSHRLLSPYLTPCLFNTCATCWLGFNFGALTKSVEGVDSESLILGGGPTKR